MNIPSLKDSTNDSTQLDDTTHLLEIPLTHFNKIPTELSVSEMIGRFMEMNREIYRLIGRDTDHSLFFSVFVLVLIKSQREDLQSILSFIEKFRRRFNKDDSEVEYYLTVYRAGVEFIEKMEYYDLNITEEEFNTKIQESSKKQEK